MKKLEIGEKYIIQCYKHDGKVHRSWQESILIYIDKDFLVFGNDKTKVINAEGKTWYTREPAILFFYKNNWFNIICQMKKTGIYYYCNIATPTVIENKHIKYIDYDLDLRVFPDGSYKVLDENEYEQHKYEMGYSKEIDIILKSELKKLIKLTELKAGPFNHEEVEKYYKKYLLIKGEKVSKT